MPDTPDKNLNNTEEPQENETANQENPKPIKKKHPWVKLVIILLAIYAALFGIAFWLSHRDWQQMKNQAEIERQEQEKIKEEKERLLKEEQIMPEPETEETKPYETLSDQELEARKKAEENIKKLQENERESRRQEEIESLTAQEQQETSTEETSYEIEEVLYGEEGVPFISDEYHYVYMDPDGLEDTIFVATHYGDKILGITRYRRYNDGEDALVNLELTNASGILFYPEIRDVYARNEFIVTEYVETYWIGKELHNLEVMYSQLEMTPERWETTKADWARKKEEWEAKKAAQKESERAAQEIQQKEEQEHLSEPEADSVTTQEQ